MTSSQLSATFTLPSCQNILSAEGRYFWGEYGDDPFNLVCYSRQRLPAAFPAVRDVPSSISFVCHQSPWASHPSSYSSLARVMGWFMTVPFSKDTPHLSAPLGSLQCVRNAQAWSLRETPVTCHQLVCPSPSQPFERWGRLIAGPRFQGYSPITR